MSNAGSDKRFVFPRWSNSLLHGLGVLAAVGFVYLLWVISLGASPRTTDVGYQPTQPVPYSHAVHVGQLGLDCRYCHNTVEKTAFAAVPPTQTCMNCHAAIKPDSPRLLPVQESYATGRPIEWIHVHRLPDYVYFDHSAHINKGVGCVECHDRVDRMEVVHQAKPLNMGWCLDCHRSPESYLRPIELVTQLAWVPTENPARLGERLFRDYGIKSSDELTNCSACHR